MGVLVSRSSGTLESPSQSISDALQTNHAPPLIFDHQMVIDSDAQILYVYGGRVIDGDWAAAPKYAGLYSFNMRLSKWQYLQCVFSPRVFRLID